MTDKDNFVPDEGLAPASTILPAAAGPLQDLSTPARSQWMDVWDQFKTHKGALFGSFVFIFIISSVYIGPLLWGIDPQFLPQGRDFINLRDTRPIWVGLFDADAKVDWSHPLGTDNLGRDMLARLMFGGQVSIAVGLTAMLLALFLGTLVGVLAGYVKKLDGILMRLTDLFLALPLLPLILVASLLFRDPLSAMFGPEGGTFILIVMLIGVTSWMPTARIVRGDVLALKEREFVLAARSIGTNNRHLILRHVLPNVLSPIMVSATLGIATAIITESALSFLGFGFPPDFPTWGRLLNDGVDRVASYPERSILPGIMISLTVLSVNYLGDGLRDALDPRIRGR
ncbi:ABC transporter permease [Falsiphaeobacter marinintestinus]|uniref:ABC transporter permease n=1 Tax=Falsiphaeobacter marinintestinus TaxID=1492905 RepID=UPI0011B36F5E|nr:ABC transporter permease [Phaeobacter marinintestinus]